ncbi:hypothetical protein [Pararhodobacter marinus]|uniref:hypothetical protein n=1 Tax=Pararhodobacter marinus TaxID=2184063 RepID=UPI0035140E92
MRALIFLCVLIAGCGRPLTVPEADLAARLFGPGLDPAPVRIVENGLVGLRSHVFPVRPRTTCRERILPPAEGPVSEARGAGVVLGNRMQIRPDLFREDYLRREGEAGAVSLGAAMFLAHELTHVWQHQNRARTGYSLWRVGREHVALEDPYLFDTDADSDAAEGARFLDYGYEQQASLVEEYVCCEALDPEGARTARLRALLSQEMSVGDLPSGLVSLPWRGVERRGICG